jgi:ATP-dependent Clp protease ATP-binding subunit ClpA
MAGGHKLEQKHKDFVYQQLALGRRSDQIVNDLKADYVISCTLQNISNYSAKTALIEALRADIKADLESHFPIARTEARLNEYQHLLREAEALGEIPIEKYIQQCTGADQKELARMMLEFAAEIARRPRDKIELQMKILRAAREEVKPLSLEVDDKRKPKAVNMKGVPPEKLRKLIDGFERVAASGKG